MGLVLTKTNSYDGMNRKLAVATGEQPLLSGLTYAAQGGMQTSTFAKGLKRVMAYNARLQPDEITDTFTGQASCGGKRRSTPANRRGCWSCSCSGLVRFGQTTARQQWQLARELIQTCNGSGFSVAENYHEGIGYDGVNRIAGFGDGSNTRYFSYDAYGKMWANYASGSTFPVSAGMPSAQSVCVNTKGQTTNQRTDASFGYDGAGNLQTSPVCTSGGCIQYDAEERQIGYGTSGASYAYDWDGQRVEKVEAGITTVYVYDAAASLAAQYSSAGAATMPCTTCYLSTDHLGSIRMVTGQSGNLIARHDYLPFGEEIPAGMRDGPRRLPGCRVLGIRRMG